MGRIWSEQVVDTSDSQLDSVEGWQQLPTPQLYGAGPIMTSIVVKKILEDFLPLPVIKPTLPGLATPLPASPCHAPPLPGGVAVKFLRAPFSNYFVREEF